jgi:hypothetical protein
MTCGIDRLDPVHDRHVESVIQALDVSTPSSNKAIERTAVNDAVMYVRTQHQATRNESGLRSQDRDG